MREVRVCHRVSRQISERVAKRERHGLPSEPGTTAFPVGAAAHDYPGPGFLRHDVADAPHENVAPLEPWTT